MVLPLYQSKDIAVGQTLPNFSPGFVAYGILIDNDTGNWLVITPGTFIVPPWTYGWSQPLNGTQSVSINLLAGPSIIPSVNLGTYVHLTVTEDRVPQSNGFTAVTAANITSAITIAGPITVNGTVGISGGVNVSGSNVNAVVTNTVSMTGSVAITGGTVNVGGTVDVSGSTVTATISNTVTITGSVTIASGTVNIGTISGTVTISGAVTVTSGTVTISGTTTISGAVTVTSGTVSISGGVTISGAVTVTSGTLNIGTVAGTVTITGTITNTINANVTNSIAVTSVGGTVTVAGTINIGNTPAVTISGTPNVNIASGIVAISGSVTVGTITAGNVQITPGSFVAGGQGVTKIAATGTALKLKAATTVKVIIVKARTANAGTIYIGTSTVTNNETAGTGGLQLDPGDMMTFTEVDIANIFINGTIGDGVSYMYWV